MSFSGLRRALAVFCGRFRGRARATAAFTLPELLVAIALTSVVALMLASVTYQLSEAVSGQTRRVAGPYAAQAALHDLSVELACAYPPPPPRADATNAPGYKPPPPPFELAPSSSPAEPLRLTFIAPEPDAADRLLYSIRHLRYEFRLAPDPADPRAPALYEWLRIESPTVGPDVDAPVTNLLYRGALHPVFEAIPPPPVDPDAAYDAHPVATWPPPPADSRFSADSSDAPPPPLPAALRMTLYEGSVPVSSATYPIQCGIPIPAPGREKPR